MERTLVLVKPDAVQRGLIGEDQGDFCGDVVPVFDHLVDLAAGVASRFLDSKQGPLEEGLDLNRSMHR